MKSIMRWITMLLGCWLCHPVWGDIYAYSEDDCTITLSNVPTDERYTLLVGPAEPADSTDSLIPAVQAQPGLDSKASYDETVDAISRDYGLESALLHAVISVESRYNPSAVSKKGAAGLMQLMPATAKRYGVANAFDPMQNITGGAKYLRDLLSLFNNDVHLALAAYNAGEGAVLKHGKRIPPYRETIKYVSRVMDFYRRYRSGFKSDNASGSQAVQAKLNNH